LTFSIACLIWSEILIAFYLIVLAESEAPK
jgi:hypothetical protein